MIFTIIAISAVAIAVTMCCMKVASDEDDRMEEAYYRRLKEMEDKNV